MYVLFGTERRCSSAFRSWASHERTIDRVRSEAGIRVTGSWAQEDHAHLTRSRELWVPEILSRCFRTF